MNIEVNASSSQDNPADLFVELWNEAVNWNPTQRALASVDSQLKAKAVKICAGDDGVLVAARLRQLIAASNLESRRRGSVFAAMLAIDGAVAKIHPRSFRRPAFTKSQRLATWLVKLREKRVANGSFAEQKGLRLIARGPLTRAARRPEASFADSLADRFAALEVVPAALRLGDQSIPLRHTVVRRSALRGVAPACASATSERIMVVPIAEAPGDFVISDRIVNEVRFVDYRLAPSINASERYIGALIKEPPVDIVIAPELVMAETQASQISALLGKMSTSACRIAVAGSGLTVDRDGDQSWNEAQVFNGVGKRLWAQRKLWPAGSPAETLRILGLPSNHSGLGIEDTASGSVLEVADIDGLGRCTVLICQDLTGVPLAPDVVRHFQPDWVFIPILDKWLNSGGWAHRLTFGLSALSAARFVVASSTSFGCIADPTDGHHCIMAVGPLDVADAEDEVQGRRLLFSGIKAGSSPGYAVIRWNFGDWARTDLKTTTLN